MKELVLSLELYIEDEEQYLYISDYSSGCKYLIKNLEEVGTYVNNYIKESEE